MREQTINKLEARFNMEPFEYQARFWGGVAIRRKSAIEARILLSNEFKLKYYTDLGFIVDYKGDCYEIMVVDDSTVVIEKNNRIIELSFDTLANIMEGKQSDNVLTEMEVGACEINHG